MRLKRLKAIGLTFSVLLALGAFAASVAYAEEGVLPPTNFTGTGGVVAFTSLANETIQCTSVSLLEGKFLTEKEKDQHATADLHLKGCKANGLWAYNTLGDEKEVILVKVLLLVCLIRELVFGLLIQPLEAVHLEVPALGQLMLLKGAVIAELEGAGLSGKEVKFKLAGKEGDQTNALECKVNGNTFKHTLELALDSQASDSMTSDTATITIKFENEIALMDT